MSRRLGDLKTFMLPIGLLIIVAIVAPWYVLDYQRHGWEHIRGFFIGDESESQAFRRFDPLVQAQGGLMDAQGGADERAARMLVAVAVALQPDHGDQPLAQQVVVVARPLGEHHVQALDAGDVAGVDAEERQRLPVAQSVIVTGPPWAICSLNSGMTDPREESTLP